MTGVEPTLLIKIGSLEMYSMIEDKKVKLTVSSLSTPETKQRKTIVIGTIDEDGYHEIEHTANVVSDEQLRWLAKIGLEFMNISNNYLESN